MANDRSNFFFNVLALENILVALNREIGDGPCFLYIEFSWIGVRAKHLQSMLIPFTELLPSTLITNREGRQENNEP